jgi:hypothetical protein
MFTDPYRLDMPMLTMEGFLLVLCFFLLLISVAMLDENDQRQHQVRPRHLSDIDGGDENTI